MKKLYSILLLLMLVALVVGCNSATAEEKTEAPATEAVQVEAEPTEAAEAPTEVAADAALTLTVWDFKSGDPTFAAYYDQIKRGFAKRYPNVSVELVAQPHDQYYSILGTAIEAGQGPDVVMFNGGTAIQDRTEALVPLDEYVADVKEGLAGWEAFSKGGVAYAVPLTIQGEPIYYNKAIYREAGLDPEKPPRTWDELNATCEAIMTKTEKSCFIQGNKEGIGFDFFFTHAVAGMFPAEKYDQWLAGEIAWDDPDVVKIFELWAETHKKGWYNPGVNSTLMFMDSWDMFSRGEGAHAIGLISDVAHWKQFEEFLGEDLGTMQPVSMSADVPDPVLPGEGGIGYAVTAWSKNPTIAADFAKEAASSEALLIFFETAGAIVSDKNIDLAKVDSPNVALIAEWLGGIKQAGHTVIPATVIDEFHRQGQNLAGGDTTVEEAIEAIKVAANKAE